MEKKWNVVHSKRFGGNWYPAEGVVRFAARYIIRRVGTDVYDVKKKVKRILDAGCGNGRHVVLFSKLGYDVYGMDISREAVEVANSWLTKEGLTAHLKVGDVEKLPFKDKFFDVVISYGVLDHVRFPKAKKAVNEIKRVLKDGGYLYITLKTTADSAFGLGKTVEKNTYVLDGGYEKGILQHYFDQGEIKELLKDFRTFDVEIHEERFPKIFTAKKAFLQSSKGTKRHVDVAKTDFGMRYSRWHIAAEKI